MELEAGVTGRPFLSNKQALQLLTSLVKMQLKEVSQRRAQKIVPKSLLKELHVL